MTKETIIEVRRHSIKDGDAKRKTIGPRGEAFAERVGKEQMQGRGYTHFFVSPMERTRQTLLAMARGAGDFGMTEAPAIPDIYLAWPELRAMWKACHMAEAQGIDMVAAALAHDSQIVTKVAGEYLQKFQAFARSLPQGSHALLVGHSPQLEFIVGELTGAVQAGLKECEGYRFLADNGALRLHPEQCSPTVAQVRAEFERAQK